LAVGSWQLAKSNHNFNSWQLAKGIWQMVLPANCQLFPANLLFDAKLRHSFLIKNDLTHILP